MIDDLDKYPVQRQWEQQQMVGADIAIGVAVLGVAAAGVSAYGSSQAASATRAGAASNAYISKMTAIAQGQSAAYSDEIDYQTAMVNSEEAAANGSILHHAARLTEQEGNAQIQAINLQADQNNSATKAAYGASGVTTDTGSPVNVAAHQTGVQQMQRADAGFTFNTKALDQDFQGTMQTYQSTLDVATAQQYKYAESVANWEEQAGIVGAAQQQSNADAAAGAQEVAGYGEALSQVGSAATSSIGTYKALSPAPAG